MIPVKVIKLEALPLTTNGKIDLKKLKSHQVTFISTKEIVLPINETERKLVEIWKNALQIAQLSTQDNFYELGGDSIKTMKILGQIQHEFGQKVEINVFSENATVAMLANVLITTKNIENQEIQPAPEAEYYPVSNTQLRFWMQYQMGLKIVANSISLFNLKEEIDSTIFESAIRLCIEKHEILRTAFIEVDKMPKQKILPATAIHFSLSSQDVTRSENWKKEVIQLAKTVYATPFDLAVAPLIKGLLLKVKEEKQVFILTLHHSIVDGWSIKLLFEEIIDTYNKFLTQASYTPTTRKRVV